eukprot:SAG11_NODE_693_length_7696_cov_5.410294_2_plen_75_part_00
MYKVRHKIVADDPDPDTLKSYDFALGDYNLEHWYWEVVRPPIIIIYMMRMHAHEFWLSEVLDTTTTCRSSSFES